MMNLKIGQELQLKEVIKILLDEEMKPLDGHEVMKKLRAINNFNTGVILLTKTNKYEYDDEYLKEGFTDYLIKPIDKDKLFEKINVREQMQKIFQKEKLPEFDSLLLYAPTFRDDGETRLFPFEEFHGENRGRAVEQLQNFLEKNQCIMCIRMHLYEKEGHEWLKALDRPGSRIRFLNEDRIEDIMEVLVMFDLLITDYSSIYIDYLLLERPILFLPYDREAYLKTRGFNFDYDEVTPGPKPKSYAEFLNSIEGLLYNEMNYVENRKKIERKFNKIQKPCSEDICRMVKMMCIR